MNRKVNFPAYFLLLFFSLFLNIQAFGQSGDSLSFPERWSGVWSGTLDIHTAQGIAQSLPMELHILPIDTSENYTWTLIYGENKEEGVRDYMLETLDAEKGLYRIDEKNSILLEAYLFGEVFVQCFDVNGSLLIVRMEKVGPDTIEWEILSGSLEPVSTTGGTTFKGEEIPEVHAYPFSVRQAATLERKK
jgi:hypothetical protein